MHKLKSTQQAYSILAFQNGSAALLEIPSTGNLFLWKVDVKDPYFSGSLCMIPRKFVKFLAR